MKKKINILTIIIVFFFITASFAVTSKYIKTENMLATKIIFIDDDNTDGPWYGTINYPFQSISDGVIHAKNGDILYVLNGTYYEQIEVDKTIHIIGESKNGVIVDAEYNNYAFNIYGDNVKIEQFTIKNTGGFKGNNGIFINSGNCEISDCVFYRHRIGLYNLYGNNTKINNCSFHTNGGGVYFEQSINSKISNCEFAHNGIGAQYNFCDNIKISNSYAHENAIPMLFDYSSNIKITDSAICDNNDNGGGVFIYNSKDLIAENCNLFHSGSGFKIVNSTQMVFTNCDLQYTTHFTIWIQDNSKDINISSCNIINNLRHGVYVTDSCCKVSNSNLHDNLVDSVFAENSWVNAKNNWWGSKLGPLFAKGLRLFDRLSLNFLKIKALPWSTKSFEKAGSDWIVEDEFVKTIVHGYGDGPIELPGDDTDADGVPNWWEEKWGYNTTIYDDHLNLDPDNDGLNNYEECYTDSYGSNPFKKDVFLEFDWTISDVEGVSNKPTEEYLNEVKQRFEEHDITLHVDLGELDGGEELPNITDFSFAELRDLYWDYFIHNDLNNPRKNIFHYGLICDNGPGTGFMFTGWAHLNAFCISTQYLSDNHPKSDLGYLIAAGSMHELGHTLGLISDDFGGIDNHANMNPKYKEFWQYINYKSVMSYQYTYLVLDYSDGDNGRGDFNDWGNLELDFFKNTHLDLPI